MELPREHVDDKDSDDIELDTLHDIPATPQAGYRTAEYDSQDFDDDIEHGNDGSATLLGSGERTRGTERIPFREASVWSQVGSIVVEVSDLKLQRIAL